jgi:asparagine synthase (glutamine-hydrolysing)
MYPAHVNNAIALSREWNAHRSSQTVQWPVPDQSMCGVNGIFAYHSASSMPAESELIATREAMRARGPDGSGVWWSTDRRCGLGHRRLSIIDLSERAAQPMVSDDGRLVVVFNGEIYNYPVLREELEADGVRFQTTSDTETLLHLYARYGDKMVHRLRGMFALAIWDEERRGLFLARDPYGIKPLYTANDGWTFRFASQVKALLAGQGVSRDPELAGVVGFHLFGSVPEPFTLYREVRALPAGHTQWIDAGGPGESRPFVNLAAVLADGAQNPVPQAEFPQLLQASVLESVKAHLLADVEVGVFLSAGVDSGALLGLMRDAGHEETRAITLAFEEFSGTDDDEAPLAACVAERYGARHVVRRVSQQEFRDDLPTILEAMDQPSIDGVNTWFVAKAAREVGLKVALSGLGGDELLAGYPSFIDLPRWRRRFGLLAAMPGLGRLARLTLQRIAPEIGRARPKALGLLEYADSWAGLYLLRRGLFLPHELSQVMDPEIAREGLRRLKPLRGITAGLVPDPGSHVARISTLESSCYMRNQLLRDVDWAAMAHGVEVRVPLVDLKLLKSMAPAIGGLLPGAGKAALAKAPKIPLPDEIVSRAKTGFGVPTESWMDAVAGAHQLPTGRTKETRGLASRRWSRVVLAAPGFAPPKVQAA